MKKAWYFLTALALTLPCPLAAGWEHPCRIRP